MLLLKWLRFTLTISSRLNTIDPDGKKYDKGSRRPNGHSFLREVAGTKAGGNLKCYDRDPRRSGVDWRPVWPVSRGAGTSYRGSCCNKITLDSWKMETQNHDSRSCDIQEHVVNFASDNLSSPTPFGQDYSYSSPKKNGHAAAINTI